MAYSHVLIPTRPTFAPTPRQVSEFFLALESTGCIPEPPDLDIAVPSGRTRGVLNPFTRETVQIEEKRHIEVGRADELAKLLDGLEVYQVMCQGKSVPRVPPLDVFDPSGEDITRACQLGVLARLRGMPETNALLKPTAATRFSILFEWGKFALPRAVDGSARIALQVSHAAESSFGLSFSQDGEYVDD